MRLLVRRAGVLERVRERARAASESFRRRPVFERLRAAGSGLDRI